LHDQCIRFIPPLNVNEWELSEGIDVFSEAVKLVTSRR
jgi:acetylornithine/succinyldiaminopimelate/putrescine aminotransferase